MSWTTTINGVSYTAPDVGENFWGTQVKNWMQAVGGTGSGQGGMLKKDGGLFQLLAEVNFGTAFGIKALTYTSGSANSGSAAGAGQIRLKRADLVEWRNNADSGNLTLGVSTSNWLQWQSVDLADISSSQTLTNKSISGLTNTISNIALSSIVAPAAGVLYSDGASILSETRLSLSRMAAGTQYYVLMGNGASSPSYQLITNNSVDAAAAIARTKLASGTASHVLINDGSGVMSSEARLSLSRTADGTNNYVLIAAGAGVSPAYGLITNSNLDAAAAIARTKIAAGSADHVIINDGAGNLSSEAQLSVSRGGTGLSAVGTSNQILGVNNAGNANEYKTFSVGTSGTDFAIAHSAGSVVFNLPDSSAANRGALTSTDWSTFNNKIGGSGTNGQVALFSAGSTITSNAAIQYSTSANSNTLSLLSGIKIGTNTTVAASAGAGAIRYNAGTLEFSDGAVWNTLGFVGAGIVSLNGLTAVTQTFAVGTAGNDFAISSATSTHTFNLPDAGASARGVVTTGTQTLAGVKTFSSNAVFSSYMTVGDIISRDNSDASISVSSGQTLWHPNLDIQTGHTYSIAGQMALVDELTGAGTVDGDGTVFDTSTDLTGYSRLDANESVTGGKTFSQRIEALGGIYSVDVTTFGSNLKFAKSSETLFSADTSDGADNKRIVFCGGGANGASRGASLELAGNENGDAGAFYAVAGTNANLTFVATGTGWTQLQGDGIGAPATSGTAQSAGHIARFKGGDNAIIDVGSNSATYQWIQATDLSTLAVNYPLALNPNGGTVSVGALFDISASTAGQIKFPATQNASADANTLDDYEEGTWTPSISFGGGTTGITYNSRVGRYLKIGRVVTAQGYVQLTSKGSSTGAANLTSLPFTSVNVSNAYTTVIISYYNAFSSLNYFLSAYVNTNATTCVFVQGSNTGGVTAITDGNFTNTSEFIFSITYEAS